jgi:hypothetical protein
MTVLVRLWSVGPIRHDFIMNNEEPVFGRQSALNPAANPPGCSVILTVIGFP